MYSISICIISGWRKSDTWQRPYNTWLCYDHGSEGKQFSTSNPKDKTKIQYYTVFYLALVTLSYIYPLTCTLLSLYLLTISKETGFISAPWVSKLPRFFLHSLLQIRQKEERKDNKSSKVMDIAHFLFGIFGRFKTLVSLIFSCYPDESLGFWTFSFSVSHCSSFWYRECFRSVPLLGSCVCITLLSPPLFVISLFKLLCLYFFSPMDPVKLC